MIVINRLAPRAEREGVLCPHFSVAEIYIAIIMTPANSLKGGEFFYT
jgi:hypothetical protein